MLNYVVSIRILKDGTQAKDSTIARKLSSIRSFFRYLNEYVGMNVSPLQTLPSMNKKKNIPEFLFVSEIKEFLNTVCEQIKYKPIRNSISEELQNHIEESKENYILVDNTKFVERLRRKTSCSNRV